MDVVINMLTLTVFVNLANMKYIALEGKIIVTFNSKYYLTALTISLHSLHHYLTIYLTASHCTHYLTALTKISAGVKKKNLQV